MTRTRLIAGGIAVASCVQGHALAVCLNGHPTAESEFREAPIVVIGEVLSARAAPAPWKGMYAGTRYTFRATEVLKGRPAKTINLFSENTSGRFPMNVGEKYLLFVYIPEYQGRRFFAVDNCGNSGKLSEVPAAVLAVRNLKAGKR